MDRTGQTWHVKGLGYFVVIGEPRSMEPHEALIMSWVHPAAFLDNGRTTSVSEPMMNGWETHGAYTRIA